MRRPKVELYKTCASAVDVQLRICRRPGQSQSTGFLSLTETVGGQCARPPRLRSAANHFRCGMHG